MATTPRAPRSYGYALLAATAFGLSIPLSKRLLADVDPLLLAGLLYLGVAAVLVPVALARAIAARGRTQSGASLQRADVPWLVGAIAAGGIAAPVLLLNGLDRTPASTAALLLGLEAGFTGMLAGLVFGEFVGRRVLLGIMVITSGGALLAVRSSSGWGLSVGALLVAGAMLCWALDNNLTKRVSQRDPFVVAGLRGIVGGTFNTVLAVVLATRWPSWQTVAAALAIGAVSYGASLVFFILSLRGIGAARTAAMFGLAPFVGAALGVAMFQDSWTWVLAPAGAAMALGTWILLSERHERRHGHEPVAQEERRRHHRRRQRRHDVGG